MKRRHFISKVFIILILLGCEGCGKKEKPPKPIPSVTTGKVKQQDVPVYVDTIGQAIPTVTVNIRPQAAGKLMDVFVQQGAIVEFGDPLYAIDPRPYQASLDQAKAQLEHDQALLYYAEQTVMRYKQVLADDYISKLTYEQYESQAEAAKAQVELDKAAIDAAQINLDYCLITAPVAGKISFYNVDVGNIVAIDDPNALTVIRPFSPIDVSYSLSQSQFEDIRAFQGDQGYWDFLAYLPEHPKNVHHGTSFFLDNQVDQNTGTILLKGRLPNENRSLWPGEFVKVQVLKKMAPSSLTVSPGAVLIGKNGPYLYIIDDKKIAHPHDITVITKTSEYVAFESKEIKEGDTVITDGQINVAPGLQVAERTANSSK